MISSCCYHTDCNETFTGQKQVPLSLSFISTIVSSSCILASLAPVTSLHPLVSSFYLLLIHHVAHSPPNLLPSSLPFSTFLSTCYPPIHHTVFLASFPFHLLLFYAFSVIIFRDWLFCNQQENTEDEKQEKIPAFFFISLTSSQAISHCPFFSFQQLKRLIFVDKLSASVEMSNTFLENYNHSIIFCSAKAKMNFWRRKKIIFKMVLLEKLWGLSRSDNQPIWPINKFSQWGFQFLLFPILGVLLKAPKRRLITFFFQSSKLKTAQKKRSSRNQPNSLNIPTHTLVFHHSYH